MPRALNPKSINTQKLSPGRMTIYHQCIQDHSFQKPSCHANDEYPHRPLAPFSNKYYI